MGQARYTNTFSSDFLDQIFLHPEPKLPNVGPVAKKLDIVSLHLHMLQFCKKHFARMSEK